MKQRMPSGKLSRYVDEVYETKAKKTPSHALIGKYDRFMKSDGSSDYIKDEDVRPNTFDMVISCSVLEHLIGWSEVDKFFSLAKENGVICLHTLICEEVPCDPDWFYLLPVHCTLWTNTAMSKVYNRYGYKGCAYHPEAQMWFFFKDEKQYEKLKEVHEAIPGSWVFSRSFVDYWKQSPYRK